MLKQPVLNADIDHVNNESTKGGNKSDSLRPYDVTVLITRNIVPAKDHGPQEEPMNH